MDRDRAPITEGKQYKDIFIYFFFLLFWDGAGLCACVPVCRSEISSTFQQLLEAGPHDVDVLDAHKLEADVGVVVLVFVTFTRRSVGQRV